MDEPVEEYPVHEEFPDRPVVVVRGHGTWSTLPND
jgi:hypothetical protein